MWKGLKNNNIYMNYLMYCFLIIVIIFFSYINSLQIYENFTPNIREFYRPIIRNARLVGEGVYDKSSSNLNNLFRKFGIL
jgi:hypothetical protein